MGRTPNNKNILDAELVVPLKYLSNFWRFLDFSSTNYEIEYNSSWSRYCIIFEMSRTTAVPANPPIPTVEATHTTWAKFQINNAKLYVSVVTLLINDNVKFWENIKQGFKITIFWNKYKYKITIHLKSNNLHYLIDPTFRNINRLFVLSLKNGDNDLTRASFDK